MMGPRAMPSLQHAMGGILQPEGDNPRNAHSSGGADVSSSDGASRVASADLRQPFAQEAR